MDFYKKNSEELEYTQAIYNKKIKKYKVILVRID